MLKISKLKLTAAIVFLIILIPIVYISIFSYKLYVRRSNFLVQENKTREDRVEAGAIEEQGQKLIVNDKAQNLQINSNINDIKNLGYTEVVNSNESDLNKYIGQKIKWRGKIVSRYSQINGIKFCIVDDKHVNPDVSTDCDWFWAIPKELITAEDPSYKDGWNGNWNEFVFKKYSTVNYNNINSESDIFVITGILESVDFDIDYNKRPVPNIEVIKIEKEL